MSRIATKPRAESDEEADARNDLEKLNGEAGVILSEMAAIEGRHGIDGGADNATDAVREALDHYDELYDKLTDIRDAMTVTFDDFEDINPNDFENY